MFWHINIKFYHRVQIPSNFQHVTILSSFSKVKFNDESWKASQFTNAPTFLLHLKNWRVKLALSLTIWTGRKLGGPRQQIQTYDLGMKSDYLTIRPLWYCMLESRSRVSHLRLGFVLPLGKCSLSTPSIGKYFIKKICISTAQWVRAWQRWILRRPLDIWDVRSINGF